MAGVFERLKNAAQNVADRTGLSRLVQAGGGTWQAVGQGYKHAEPGVVINADGNGFTGSDARKRLAKAMASAFADWGIQINSSRELNQAMSKQGLPFSDPDDMRQVLSRVGLQYEVHAQFDPERNEYVDTGYLRDVSPNGTGEAVHAHTEVFTWMGHDHLAYHANLMGQPGRGFGQSVRDYDHGFAPEANLSVMTYTVSGEQKAYNSFVKRLGNDHSLGFDNALPPGLDQGLATRLHRAKEAYRRSKNADEKAHLERLQVQAWSAIEQTLEVDYNIGFEVGQNGTSFLRDLKSEDDGFRVQASQVFPALSHEHLSDLVGISHAQYERKIGRVAKPSPGAGLGTAQAEAEMVAQMFEAGHAQTAARAGQPSASESDSFSLDPDTVSLSRDPSGALCAFYMDPQTGGIEELSVSPDQLPRGRSFNTDEGVPFTVSNDGSMFLGAAMVAEFVDRTLTVAGRSFDMNDILVQRDDASPDGYRAFVEMNGDKKEIATMSGDLPEGAKVKDFDTGQSVTVGMAGPEFPDDEDKLLHRQGRQPAAEGAGPGMAMK